MPMATIAYDSHLSYCHTRMIGLNTTLFVGNNSIRAIDEIVRNKNPFPLRVAQFHYNL